MVKNGQNSVYVVVEWPLAIFDDRLPFRPAYISHDCGYDFWIQEAKDLPNKAAEIPKVIPVLSKSC